MMYSLSSMHQHSLKSHVTLITSLPKEEFLRLLRGEIFSPTLYSFAWCIRPHWTVVLRWSSLCIPMKNAFFFRKKYLHVISIFTLSSNAFSRTMCPPHKLCMSRASMSLCTPTSLCTQGIQTFTLTSSVHHEHHSFVSSHDKFALIYKSCRNHK